MKLLHSLLLAIIILLITADIYAQPAAQHDSIADAWPLTTGYHLAIGHEEAFDTYISPLMQSGTIWSLGGDWWRGFSKPKRRLYMWFATDLKYGALHNPARNNSCTDLQLTLSWQGVRTFSPLPGLCVAPAAGVMADAGMLYLPANSNNPVSARLYAGLTLGAFASYQLTLGSLPLRFTDRLTIPTLGAFFSPHYGQSYYEIYLGQHSDLVRCGWWGNHFCIDNLLYLEVPVRSVRLQIGYRFSLFNSRASLINSRITTHALQLGICTDWLNITRRK